MTQRRIIMTTTDFGPDDLTQPPPALSYDIVSWLLTGVALFLVLPLHLLPALVAGLVVYELVHVLARVLKIFRIHHKRGQLAAVGIVAFGVVLLLTIAGLGIGVLASLRGVRPHEPLGPLARAMQERVVRVGEAFRRVVFAQTRISAVNTFLTAVYLFVALPLAGVHLPLAKTVLVITFLVGLLPVVGNLVSNSIIVILSLSVSLSVGIASLIFLVVIHKLEYFLNAHMIGAQVHARAWEILLAMLVMEAAFGIPGLIAAPIYYAYVKDELVSRRLV